MTLSRLFLILLPVCALLLPAGVHAEDPPAPVATEPTGVIEKSGEFLPKDATFLDENGKAVTLGELIDKPTLLLPVYYTCPQICSFDMANLALALQLTKHPPDSFSVITISFNHEESIQDAARTKKNYSAMLKDRFPENNWHFLTGTLPEIRKVTDSIGYSFRAANDGLFIHPSALVAIGSDGKIIKYVYGTFLSGDVDLAIAEAVKGTPAASIKRFLAYCLSGDIRQNKTVFQFMKGGILLLLVTGGFFLFRLLKRDR